MDKAYSDTENEHLCPNCEPSKVVLYRLLRPNEDPSRGLYAKNPSSDVSVEDHVTDGSRGRGSRFISCCKSYSAIERFVARTWTSPVRIVQIEIDKDDSDIIEVIDLTVPETFEEDNWKGRNFASWAEEVLVVGKISPECITELRE
ncbi:uncharacterized protein LOC133182889 [Saccostrea echinata]|uniref:uncharacterized protein LOC133182889 n=1 Tax=Saccostrea echinata TaxID=191078 RepID=UPI002A83176E|nr:uncharacterized protein LOC133182889 [Saccostrea echinata]